MHAFQPRLTAIAMAILLVAGCATAPPSATPSAPSSPASPVAGPAAAAPATASAASAPAGFAGSPVPRPDAPPPKPFAEVIREAKQQDGFLPVWRKDEKVWLEIPAERIGQPFLLSVNISNSVGERGLYASQMGPSWLAEFRRIGNTVQLVAKNTDFRGGSEPALQQAVRQAFSDSLLGAAPVASAEHPQRKSILVDAGFLLSDLPGYSTVLEAAYRLPYGLDRGNSYFAATRSDEHLTTLNAQLHFATARIPAAPLVPPPPPIAVPTPPTTTPDPRSLFVGTVINFSRLAATPMTPRPADPRLGHFSDTFTDLGSDLKANPRVHNINRWRLEKKNADDALSEPVQPITYWLDKNIPPRYRATVEAGVLEWNLAFERIGFKNAIVVKQQPDDADFDDMDAGHASIRWFVGADVGFAIGPNHSDPRTGEILDADIGMSDVFARGARRFLVEDIGSGADAVPAALPTLGQRSAQAQQCVYAAEAAAQADFALELLEARGDIAPDSPEAEAFVQSVVKDTVMHEVGHTLGLKHNFKASTTVSRAQLEDKAYTASHGISGSVMDYNAYNLPLRGEPAGNFNSTTLGPYDYWAIEYAYKPIAAGEEAAELGRIAGRSTDPALAYADDADAGGFGPFDGLDPAANRFDLGDDPLAYYRKRLALTREVWDRTQARGPRANEDPQRQRRVLFNGFRLLRSMPTDAAKYVGGMYTVRDLPGSTDRPNFKPVEPARQREALQFLAKGIFSADSFRFRPEFLANLSPDYNEFNRGGPINIPAIVLQFQTQALDRLLAANTAQRLLDLPSYLSEGERRGVISLGEVYATLQSAVWSELGSGQEIERMRRNLQREHLKRLQALLTRGSPTLPPDALSLARLQAVALQAQLRAAAARGGLSMETRAHLQDSLGTLTEALKATMQRSS